MAETQQDKNLYSLKKSRHIMQTSYDWYKKRYKKLTPEKKASFEADMEQLDQALLSENQVVADEKARKLENFCKNNFKKSFFEYAWELAVALVLALLIASVVRMVWFEPYEIPTGSMRPTFKEQDHLTVSKLPFGINVPFLTKHFYFDPDHVQRTSVFIFSGANMPFIDQETTYFGVIPYTKRYIKRAMGKPGDTLYFYGGKVYAIDSDGKPLTELLDAPWMKNVEHIPFITFEGHVTQPNPRQVAFNQMHIPVGRMTYSATGNPIGEVFNGKEWVKDQPTAQNKSHDTIQTYSDVWGIRNYAMARLLTKDQLKLDPSIDTTGLADGVLYLELRHTPSLSYSKPIASSDRRGGTLISPYTTVIPLQQKHLDAILDNMYTARFVVDDGRATRYNVEGSRFGASSPRFPGVPNGTYEFYFGKADKVGWAALTSPVPADSPLYKKTPENVQKLFNVGVEFDNSVAPGSPSQRYYPQRYAYFRDGDLYLMGAPILKKDDPVLVAFNKSEAEKAEKSSSSLPYAAFKDYGPPVKADGSYDKDFIRTFGVKVPEKHYVALGDNHAMSSDSRVFGFVPEDNLQGAPSWIVWPPGDRWGAPEQKPYPIFVLSRLVVWGIVAAILAIWYAIHRHNLKKPIFKKLP